LDRTNVHYFKAKRAPSVVNRRTLLERAVQRAALFLPPHVVGAPFSYENPLRVFEDLDFEVAVMDAARLYGAQPFLREEAYYKALAAGEFLADDIDAILAAERNAAIAGRLDRFERNPADISNSCSVRRLASEGANR
jgi:hypothetical protein